MKKKNLVIADDHPLIIHSARALIADLPDIQLIGCAQNPTELHSILEKNLVDILVTDYAMPDNLYSDGITMINRIQNHFPDTKIIVFTALSNVTLLLHIKNAGVHGILNKASMPTELIAAINYIAHGKQYICPYVQRLFDKIQQKKSHKEGGVKSLSKREIEVLRLFLNGKSIQEIAEQFNRSIKTISNQKLAAMQKLGCKNDAALFQHFALLGLEPFPISLSQK